MITADTHRWLDESPYRLDAWVQQAGHAKVRAGYAIVDLFGWCVVTRNAVTRVDGHGRAARAAVRVALWPSQTGAAVGLTAAANGSTAEPPSAASGTERGADALGAVPRDSAPQGSPPGADQSLPPRD